MSLRSQRAARILNGRDIVRAHQGHSRLGAALRASRMAKKAGFGLKAASNGSGRAGSLSGLTNALSEFVVSQV